MSINLKNIIRPNIKNSKGVSVLRALMRGQEVKMGNYRIVMAQTSSSWEPVIIATSYNTKTKENKEIILNPEFTVSWLMQEAEKLDDEYLMTLSANEVLQDIIENRNKNESRD